MLERFWAKVVVRGGDDCWPYGTGKGYGRFWTGRCYIGAHRLSLTLATGEDIPQGMVAMHSCDNPPCVNPSHLETVTQNENAHRRPRPTHCTKGHELTEDNIYYTKPKGNRWKPRMQCRVCHTARGKARRERRADTGQRGSGAPSVG